MAGPSRRRYQRNPAARCITALVPYTLPLCISQPTKPTLNDPAMTRNNSRILVFARAPAIGAVKTRLIPRLGAEGAARLHAALVRHTVRTAVSAALAPVELWCTPDTKHPFFVACAAEFGVALEGQIGADLGARMNHALTHALDRARFALLVGSDCPTLDAEGLAEALQALASGADAAITPATDGGYVLIGLRRPAAALFDDMPWGTGAVMEHTRERLRTLGWQWHETAPLADLDTPDDLDTAAESLRSIPDLPP